MYIEKRPRTKHLNDEDVTKEDYEGMTIEIEINQERVHQDAKKERVINEERC